MCNKYIFLVWFLQHYSLSLPLPPIIRLYPRIDQFRQYRSFLIRFAARYIA